MFLRENIKTKETSMASYEYVKEVIIKKMMNM
jgi:hypothetical protein